MRMVAPNGSTADVVSGIKRWDGRGGILTIDADVSIPPEDHADWTFRGLVNGVEIGRVVLHVRRVLPN